MKNFNQTSGIGLLLWMTGLPLLSALMVLFILVFGTMKLLQDSAVYLLIALVLYGIFISYKLKRNLLREIIIGVILVVVFYFIDIHFDSYFIQISQITQQSANDGFKAILDKLIHFDFGLNLFHVGFNVMVLKFTFLYISTFVKKEEK
jgi:hypothetical protein